MEGQCLLLRQVEVNNTPSLWLDFTAWPKEQHDFTYARGKNFSPSVKTVYESTDIDKDNIAKCQSAKQMYRTKFGL